MTPVLTIPARITRPEHLVEHLAQVIDGSDLGINYVAKYDDDLLPKYPAVLIMAGPLQKNFHGTHTFSVSLHCEIYLFHAVLSEERSTRTLKDLMMATRLVELLESNLTLGGRILVGWVDSEVPGINPPRSTRSNSVISTRLTFRANLETRFK